MEHPTPPQPHTIVEANGAVRQIRALSATMGTPPPSIAAGFRDLADALAGPVRQSAQNAARAFAGWPTDRQQPEHRNLRSPRHVVARRRAANRRARATRQAQRRG